MGLKIYKVAGFDYRTLEWQFAQLAKRLGEAYADEDCVLVGNVRMEGVMVDAIIITRRTIRIIALRNRGGCITAREQGAWTADGKILAGGGMCKTPLQAMRMVGGAVSRTFASLLQRNVGNCMKCIILFSQSCTLNDQLSDTTHRWLELCDMEQITQMIAGDKAKPETLSESELAAIPQLLKVEQYEVHCNGDGLTDAPRHSESPFVQHTADAFFEQLAESCPEDVPLDVKYATLRDVFYRAVEQRLADSKLTFSGLFAKVDYLLKESDIPRRQASIVHVTRARLFPQTGAAKPTLDSETYYADLRTTATFVSVLNGKATIPQVLKQHFPRVKQQDGWGTFSTSVLRTIVNEWDDEYIYVIEENTGQELKVCYSSANQYLTRGGKGDWSYLRDILREGTQLNLVRLRMEEDVCMPELIIYEPDLLINITTIAACFDDAYKESPFVALLQRIGKDHTSYATHLGNLAGQLLDETVHHRQTQYDDVFDAFFHANALNLACCEDLKDDNRMAELKLAAEHQKEIIDELIGQHLPRAVDGYDRTKVVLEPSFYSQVLGIQGRLDFLYESRGKTVIVEQKSGKGQYVRPGTAGYDPDVPVPVGKHIVQLLLYRALFVYEFSRYSDQLRHIFLLYSKYAKGLVSVAQMPELMLRALRMRNLLAWAELTYASDGFRVLDSLTPTSFRGNDVSDRYWETWKLPQVRDVLAPIHAASPLERAYFYRFMQFLAVEQLQGRMGNKVKEDSGFAATWLQTLEAKRTAGNIYDNLCITSLEGSGDTVCAVELRFAQSVECDTSNFRKGDIVFIYSYKNSEEPNACAQTVHRGSITSITTTHVSMRLRNSQTDRKVFDRPADEVWAMEHDMMDAAAGSMYRAMHSFLTAPTQRRDMLMLQRQFSTDQMIGLNGDYGTFNELVLRAKRARDMFIVIGPPGTGKTSFGMLNILCEELTSPDASVLLLSYTNRAVDEMCSKLVEEGIDFVRLGSDLSCDERYQPYLASSKLGSCKTLSEVRVAIRSARVFCGTTASLNANMALFGQKQFTLAIVDESSQILEPHLIGLICASVGSTPAIGRFVLIGDHKQLPAVVQQSAEESAVTEPELIGIGLTDCRLSLFERMLRHFKTGPGQYDPNFVYMLTRQGRMHRDIADFPNKAFYGGKLQIVGSPILPHQDRILPETASTESRVRNMLITQAVAFVATPQSRIGTSDKVNQLEADLMAETIMQIYLIAPEEFDKDHTVGVIVPYRNQIATVRNAVDRLASERGICAEHRMALHDISIDTVERYQGSQRDYILYGFTIQRDYQLNFLASNTFMEDGVPIDRKLNVAMTRARLHMVMFGNPQLLRLNTVFNDLMLYMRERGAYYDHTLYKS